jgi:3-hydroxyisobutyrate dehydrogenase-like beta-hydroxyacid dehydrogenase
MIVALIGYGEVGRILAEDLRAAGHELVAFDVKLRVEAGKPLRAHARAHDVALVDAPPEAVRRSALVVSAVTADQTVAAAEACAGAMPPGSFFLDLNSSSPGAKIRAAKLIAGGGGGRFVEGAVMTAVPPHRLRVPLLLGGPDAAALAPVLKNLGFAPKVASGNLGVASATKLCRSVVIKGLEALVIESFTAARRYGVEEDVVASLEETFPGIDWEKQATYFFQRVIQHGRRRAEEMREAAAAVREAGLEPWHATATAQRQSWIADLADQEVFGLPTEEGFARTPDWRREVDRMLGHLSRRRRD